jgi:hypothetical protein
LGLLMRTILLNVIHRYVPNVMSDQSLLITFCFGALMVVILGFLHKFLVRDWSTIVRWFFRWLRAEMKTVRGWLYASIIGFVVGFLLLWGGSLSAIVYILIGLGFLSWYVVELIADIGIAGISSYVWLIVLPLVYLFAPSSVFVVAVAVFATLCVGLVLDAMVVYKLADLAGVSYLKVLRYQMVGLVCAAVTVGLFFIWYSQDWSLGSFELVAPKAQELDQIIHFGRYDYKVLFLGFLFGLGLLFTTHDMLVVIGAILMEPSVSVWLILSGACAHLIKNRERYYPLWFSMYAGHVLWLIASVFV